MSDVRQLTRLAGILARLDSPYDGERAAAGLLASRELRKLGLTWPELLCPRLQAPDPPAWRETVNACLARAAKLTAWEADFLAVLARYQINPSGRQMATLEGIADRVL